VLRAASFPLCFGELSVCLGVLFELWNNIDVSFDRRAKVICFLLERSSEFVDPRHKKLEKSRDASKYICTRSSL
jgi:hypothetical protein